MGRFARTLLLAATGLALAACSSLSLTGADKLRSIDYVNDDVASLLLAFDVPLTLEPVPDGSTMTFTLGGQVFTAVLARADLDQIAGTLPPPGRDRTYYLFGFSDADKARIHTLQAAARTGGASTNLSVSMSPLFCRNTEIDPANVRFSVLLSLPGGGGLQPLFSNTSLADALAQAPAKTLPLCAGHSG